LEHTALKLLWVVVGSALIPVAVAASNTAAPPRADVLDVRALARDTQASDSSMRELSGLDWDAARQRLVAVSDRGWVLELVLDPRAQTLASLEIATSVAVRAPAKPRVNAESVVARPDGWWVADEARRRVLDVGREGKVRGERALPGGLGDNASTSKGSSSDVEAVAHHPRHGLLAVAQRPRATDPQGTHVVHAEDGRTWSLAVSPGGRSTIKAADLRGDRLRLLEKVDPDEKGAPYWFVVREIDLAAGMPLRALAWVIDDARLAGHNLEGLACLDDARCVLVSDSGGSKAGDVTLFVLVRLPAPAR
jgi:Esterase-like activity of phytase